MGMVYNSNVRISRSSYALLKGLVDCYGHQVSSDLLTRCGHSDKVYRIDAPVTASTRSSLTVGGVTIQCDISRLTPPEQQALPGKPALSFPKTDGEFAALAHCKGQKFADMLRSTLQELRTDTACWPLPIDIKFQSDHIYIYSAQRKIGNATDWFLALDFGVQLKDQPEPLLTGTLGINTGFTTPFVVAPTSCVADVRTFAVPEPLAQWVQQADLRDTDQWDLARQAFYYASLPAFRFCAQAATVRIEDLSFGRYMSQEYVRRARLCGLTDGIMAALPVYLTLQGTEVVRVPPVGTSTTCHICRQPGQRRGDRFTCREHGEFNAHANAAMLIRDGGVLKEWGQWPAGNTRPLL